MSNQSTNQQTSPRPSASLSSESSVSLTSVPSEVSEGGESQKAKSSGPRTPHESYRERSVRIAYQEGSIKCNNVRHFRMVVVKDSKFKQPLRVAAADLLAAMKIGADATCDCERTACKEAWKWNAPGVFETEWVQPGSFHKGWGKYDSTKAPRRVMPLNYHLSDEQREYLHKVHPGWLFVTVGTGYHDHPIAHTTTQLATYNLFHSLPKGDWLDMHGNPSAAETFNAEKNGRSVHCVNNVESARDVLRKKTKWGPKQIGGKVRWRECALRDLSTQEKDLVEKVDGMTSVHTLYYIHPSELPAHLSKTKGQVLHAIMHRFVGERGELNNGEQTWERIRDATGYVVIKQTNVKTGEVYEHADNERWFANKSWAPFRGAECMEKDLNEENSLVWDTNLAADGTYLFRICTATLREANLDVSYCGDVEEKPLVVNSDAWIERNNKVVLKTSMGKPLEIAIPAPYHELLKMARLKMVGAKERSVSKYVAHSQYVTLKINGVMAMHPECNDVQTIYDVVYASFWIDACHDKGYEALIGTDTRKLVIDTIVHGLDAKSTAGFIKNTLSHVRNHV